MRTVLAALIIVVGIGVLGYVLIAAPSSTQADSVTATVTRSLPAAAVPGNNMWTALSFNLSEPREVAIHEKYVFNGETQWHNFSVRNAYNQTVRYPITVPEDMTDTVTVSGSITPDTIQIRGDTTLERFTSQMRLFPDNVSAILPQQAGDFHRTGIETEQVSAPATTAATATYTTDTGEHQVTVRVFESAAAAGQYLNTIVDNENADTVPAAIDLAYTITRDDRTFRAWNMRNMYLEVETTGGTALVHDLREGISVE